jgi:hypothetical protein
MNISSELLNIIEWFSHKKRPILLMEQPLLIKKYNITSFPCRGCPCQNLVTSALPVALVLNNWNLEGSASIFQTLFFSLSAVSMHWLNFIEATLSFFYKSFLLNLFSFLRHTRTEMWSVSLVPSNVHLLNNNGHYSKPNWVQVSLHIIFSPVISCFLLSCKVSITGKLLLL